MNEIMFSYYFPFSLPETSSDAKLDLFNPILFDLKLIHWKLQESKWTG